MGKIRAILFVLCLYAQACAHAVPQAGSVEDLQMQLEACQRAYNQAVEAAIEYRTEVKALEEDCR